MSKKFYGVVPPVCTPLLADRSFDKASFVKQVNRLIDAGMHGLFILGSSGEVAFSTRERRREVLAAAQETIAGRVPFLAGVIDTQTDRVIEHVRDAEEFGADGLVVTAPFYALGGEAQVERHFRAIREATELPIFAYDIPVCVHTKLSVDLLMRLAEDGVIQGVKDSSGDDVSFRLLCLRNKAAGSPLAIFTGHEVVVDGAYMSGADGSVPGLGNVDPDGYIRQWNAFQAGDWETVRAEQDRLADVMQVAMVAKGISGYGAGVGGFKTALQLMGIFETNQMSEPVQAQTGENVEAVRAVLVRNGLLEG